MSGKNMPFSKSWLLLGILVSTLMFTALLTTPAQAVDSVDCDSGNFSCSEYPDVGVCVNGSCSCNETTLGDCFELTINGTCKERRCYQYLADQMICRKGTQSRTTAILLSVFLINFGAANFYIQRYELAIPQIILGLLLCFFQFGSCGVASARDDDTSIPCIICCSINSLISILFLAWWIADLAIFVNNSRPSGNGCPLY